VNYEKAATIKKAWRGHTAGGGCDVNTACDGCGTAEPGFQQQSLYHTKYLGYQGPMCGRCRADNGSVRNEREIESHTLE